MEIIYVNKNGYPTDVLNSVLSDNQIKQLLKMVELKCATDKIIFELNKLDLGNNAGAFVKNSMPPKILIHPDIGIKKSNVAHELIHVMHAKDGLTVYFDEDIYSKEDKRYNVLRALNNNILHVRLMEEFKKHGFNVRESIEHFLRQIEDFISKDVYTVLPYRRIHYNAVNYIRLYFEGYDLSQVYKEDLLNRILTKDSNSLALSRELIKIIDEYDTSSREGCLLALYKCIKFINLKDISAVSFDWQENIYDDAIKYLENKHPLLVNS